MCERHTAMAQNPKRPTGPSRDPLSVGLGRHRRQGERRLPPWLEEYGVWIAIAVVVIAFVVPVQMLGIFDQKEAVKPTAALRAVSVPIKSWAEGSSTKIESIAVDVENVGPEEARQVTVSGVVRGTSFPLTGPAVLEAGQRGRFIGKTALNVMSEDEVSVGLSCANCPPAP